MCRKLSISTSCQFSHLVRHCRKWFQTPILPLSTWSKTMRSRPFFRRVFEKNASPRWNLRPMGVFQPTICRRVLKTPERSFDGQ
ncbi:hypothetical protein HanIR_Chr17g0871901 [Helianthus annuus]|nr:hypothetical protein HanIR_Chr17g0871901 [Helianthus annuus]